MGELQKLYVTLALNAADLNKGLGQAEKDIGGFGSRMRGKMTGAFGVIKSVGVGALLGVGAAAVGGFALAGSAAISMNASLEQSTMQFTTLMGDADLAAEHVKNLFEFGAKTPFETEPIIQASKHLQVFGGAALNTMGNLTLVGDAAAAIGAPIDEVSFWVGRLYSNLQGGQPFGEAAMRLQELGIMTPAARQAMEEMQAAGANANDTFGYFQGTLGAFTGAMEMQSQSWAGLTSTIKDQLGLAAAEGLKPFFDLAKEALGWLSEWLARPETQASIQALAEAFRQFAEKLSAFVTDVIVPFVQTHAEEMKTVLIALAGILLLSVVPAIVSVVVSALPLILVMGLIVAAVLLVKKAWDENWGGIREKTFAVWEFLKKVFANVVDWIQNSLIPWVKNLYERWKERWETMQTVLQNVWTIVRTIWKEVGRWINDNLVPWIDFFKNKWEEDWEKSRAKLDAVWKFIEPIWKAIKDWFAVTIGPLLDKFKDKMEDTWEKAKEALTPFLEAWNGVVGAVQGFWNWLSGIVFRFKFEIPDLPDWATPGSPIPLHTAWKAFAADIDDIGRRLSHGFKVGLAVDEPELRLANAAVTSGRYSGGTDNSRRMNLYGGLNIYTSQGAEEAVEDIYRMQR